MGWQYLISLVSRARAAAARTADRKQKLWEPDAIRRHIRVAQRHAGTHHRRHTGRDGDLARTDGGNRRTRLAASVRAGHPALPDPGLHTRGVYRVRRRHRSAGRGHYAEPAALAA